MLVFDLVFDEDTAREVFEECAAEGVESGDTYVEAAVRILNDRSGLALLKHEQRAMKELQCLLAPSSITYGSHDEHGALDCWIGVDSPADVLRIWRILLDRHGVEDENPIISLDTHFMDAQTWMIFPTGFDGAEAVQIHEFARRAHKTLAGFELLDD